VWPAPTSAAKEERKHKYASKYLWGIDFDERSAKVSRALMLIAGDGRSHVFRANSLDPRDWFRTQQGEALRTALRQEQLLANKPSATKLIKDAEAWDYFSDLKFDLILTNPPFAGEIRDRELLRKYRLADPAVARKSKKGAKEERDVLFIERCIHMLKPGGRMAIVLPQGKFNNALLSFIRHWILRKARLIGVVGLHGNTFKPHTGTKTSVLLLSKYTDEERQSVEDLVASISNQAPNYREIITQIVNAVGEDGDVEEAQLSDEIADALVEKFSDMPTEQEESGKENAEETESSQDAPIINGIDPDTLKEEIEEKEGALSTLADAITKIRSQKKAVRLKKTDDVKVLASKTATLEELAHAETKLVPQLKAVIGELKDLRRKLALVTTKGRLMLLAEDEKAIGRITEAWVTEQLSGKLHYPVFMATSQESGKDSSGEYVYRYKDGTFTKDAGGNPPVQQDCVSYVEGEERIAEAFIKWAKKHELPFWKEA
jgi:type I restriction enzyme M protein